MDLYLMYLRKSRMDTDYETVSVKETLSRHRTILEDFCKAKKLHVVEILEEVVSGESLYARPEMMRLLDLINTGMYAGVVSMDIERLSRGSSLESGHIMQVLQVNNCKIITPGKTYDLQNDSDEQFTDMKFMGSMAPYGYRAFKLPGEKGNSLCIEPEEAKVVQMIFEMSGKQGMGYTAIAYALNDMHIPARMNGEWNFGSIVNILNNEVYLGKIRWGREPVKRVIKDGMVAKKRFQNNSYELYEGRHEAIITQEQWDLAKAAQAKRNHNPVNVDRKLRNPFVGILFCGKCGGIMKRNVPSKKRNPTPWYRCNTRGCDCRIMKCATVEAAIHDAMEEWLDEYIVQLDTSPKPKIDPIETALETLRGQISSLQAQQEKICEYLEKGIYTAEMFTKRNLALANEIKQLYATEADLVKKKNAGDEKESAEAQIIPTAQHILESYPILSVEEKNRLWKLVLKKATIYRSPDDEVTIRIYPNLPK